jgi:hypothetical protein
MEWPLPLWLVLEEESEELFRNRPSLGANFAHLLDWSFKPEEVYNINGIILDILARKDCLSELLKDEIASRHKRNESSTDEQAALDRLSNQDPFPDKAAIATFLTRLLPLRALHRAFSDIPDSRWVKEVATCRRKHGNSDRVNRYLLESTFPTALLRIERFKVGQIKDNKRLVECLRAKKVQLFDMLAKDRGKRLQKTDEILTSDSQPSEEKLVEALNELLGFSGLYRAFPELPEAKWVARWLFVPGSPDKKYDPSHGNRILLEAAFPQVKKLDDEFLALAYAKIHSGHPTAALCLSGGGIRSATFSLGVIQGLAKHNLLRQFDYLSTVSGGGYLGGWLSAWVHRDSRCLLNVSKELSGPKDSKREPENDPIYYLREFSNYLAPKPGLLSGDTWTLGAIYLRNLFLNWLILIPLFAIILSIPFAALTILRAHAPASSLHLGSYWSTPPLWEVTLVSWLWLWKAASSGASGYYRLMMVAVSVVAGSLSIAYAALATPSSYKSSNHFVQWIVGRGTQRRFLFLCLAPRYIAAVLFALYWFWHVLEAPAATSVWPLQLWGWEIMRCEKLVLYGALVGLCGGLLYTVASWRFVRDPSLFAKVVIAMTVSAGVAGLILYSLSLLSPAWLSPTGQKLYVCLAVPFFVIAFVVADGVFQGLASRFMKDEDREWVARSAAWILIAAVMWMALAFLSLFGPPLILSFKMSAISAALALGLPSVLGGWSSKVPATTSQEAENETGPWVSLALKLLPILGLAFILLLGAALALGVEALLTAIAYSLGYTCLGCSAYSLAVNAQWPRMLILGFCALLFVIMIVAGFSVDVNKFSMHAMYRSRLIRAFLGASRKRGDRSPNLFTGFDPHDNLPMCCLARQQPLPIMNITLNLVGGVANRLAWQERKAETFTVSPFHSGNFWWGYRDTRRYGGDDKKGISLGTAMSISGAAVSPNCGYASSPVLTFLLAIFNARLGWWLGNPGPAGETTFRRQTPLFAATPLFQELIGRTNDYTKYVYLSDGGHFENLGLYEMVLRRCHYIVVVDAGADPNYAFTDLGNAVRKIRIDLGIPIDFNDLGGGLAALMKNQTSDVKISRAETPFTTNILADKRTKTNYCAIATIEYSAIDHNAPDGVLIYIKATLTGSEPADVTEYERKHNEFPNESTVNQFFDESQFESYRMLGLHEIDCILRTLTAPNLAKFEHAVRQYLNSEKL